MTIKLLDVGCSIGLVVVAVGSMRSSDNADYVAVFRSWRDGIGKGATSYTHSQIAGYPTCTVFSASIDRHSPIRYTESWLIIRSACAIICFGTVFESGGHKFSDQPAGHRSVSVVLMLVSTFPCAFNDFVRRVIKPP